MIPALISRLATLTAAAALALGLAGTASANPLSTNDWTQVGWMSPDGNAFNGQCKLDLSGACSYNSATDFWHPFATATEILFITADGQFWGQASYPAIRQLVTAQQGTFGPNLTWIDAGKNGVSAGALVGNVLSRNGVPEDPWVTLEGSHCAHMTNAAPCNTIIWGEAAFQSWTPAHSTLQMNGGGIQVWARDTSQHVPEPGSFALVGLAMAGLGLARRRAR